MFLRFFLPRSILEPSSKFSVGFPSDYALGVDTKWQQQYRIWVDKTSDRIFVIYAVTTVKESISKVPRRDRWIERRSNWTLKDKS
jgi:hypothetical protein